MKTAQRRTEATDSELAVTRELGTIHHSCSPEKQRLSRGREGIIGGRGFSRPHVEVVGMGKMVVRKLEVSYCSCLVGNMFGFLWLVLS